MAAYIIDHTNWAGTPIDSLLFSLVKIDNLKNTSRVLQQLDTAIKNATKLKLGDNVPEVEGIQWRFRLSQDGALSLAGFEFENLRKLNLPIFGLGISTLEDLDQLPNLEKLQIRTEPLNIDKIFSFKGKNDNLKALNLTGSFIRKIEGLDCFPNLENLNAPQTKLTELSLEGLNNLRILDLGNAQKLMNLKDLNANTLPNLEELNLNNTSLLRQRINFTGMNTLKKLSLSQSQITVEGFDALVNLEALNIEEFRGGGETLLTGFDKLKKLALNSVEYISDENGAFKLPSSLEELKLNRLGDLAVDLTDLINLKKLTCPVEILPKLRGISSLSKLEEIDLSYTPSLADVRSTGSKNEERQRVSLNDSNFPTTLKVLKLKNNRYTKFDVDLTFNQENKELKLDLKGSPRITITNIENLDQDNITR